MGHDGEEAGGPPGGIYLLLIECEAPDGPVCLVVVYVKVVVVTPYGRIIVQTGAHIQYLLKCLTLHGYADIKGCQFGASADRIEVQVQLQSVRGGSAFSLAPYSIIQIKLLVIESALRIDIHSGRTATEVTEGIDPFEHQLLANLYTHDHRLTGKDVSLQVLQRLITPVRDQDYTGKACMADVSKYGLNASRVGDVAGECPVVNRHMTVKGVHHRLNSLLQWQPLLVLAPPDIGECVSIRGTARGVNGAELSFLKPGCTMTEQLHPVLLRNGLGDMRDLRRCKLS